MPDMFQSPVVADSLQPLTIKKRATAEFIHADLNERIERLAVRDPKFQGCASAMPKPLKVSRENAPNWTVDGFIGLPSGGFNAMVKIIDQVRLEYELID